MYVLEDATLVQENVETEEAEITKVKSNITQNDSSTVINTLRAATKTDDNNIAEQK